MCDGETVALSHTAAAVFVQIPVLDSHATSLVGPQAFIFYTSSISVQFIFRTLSPKKIALVKYNAMDKVPKSQT